MTEESLSQFKPRKWWLAGLLSIVQPGLGQIYNGQALKGATFFLIIWVVPPIPASIVFVKYLSVTTFLLLLALGLALGAAVIVDAIVNAKRTGGTYRLKRYNRIGVYVGIVVAFTLVTKAKSWFVRAYIVQAFKIPASSMEPTLLIGDAIVVDKLHGSKSYPHRGDIIVFEYPDDPEKIFIKRVKELLETSWR